MTTDPLGWDVMAINLDNPRGTHVTWEVGEQPTPLDALLEAAVLAASTSVAAARRPLLLEPQEALLLYRLAGRALQAPVQVDQGYPRGALTDEERRRGAALQDRLFAVMDTYDPQDRNE